MSQVLLVVADKTALTPDDVLVRDRLSVTLSHTVTVVSDDDPETGAAGKDFIVLTSSVNSAVLMTKYRSSPLPILAFGYSTNLWPNLGLCTTVSNTNSSNWHAIATDGNPLLAGNTGTFSPFSSNTAGSRFANGLIAGAIRLATAGGSDNGNNVYFDVPAGTTLVDGTTTAAGRRIGMEYNDGNLTAYATAAWWGMFDAAVAALASGLSVVVTANPTNILTTGTTTVTATATGGSGTKSYSWTRVSGPVGTFASPAAASTTFTPTGGAGTYDLRCTVSDASGTQANDVNVFVSEPASYVTYTSVDVATGWTPTGGTNLQVLTDASGSTYVTSSANPTSLELTGTLGALTPPPAGQPLTVLIDCDKISASSGSVVAKLYEGTTLRSTVTVSSIPNGVASSPVSGQITVNFPAADIAAVTSWASLKLTLLCTSAP